MSSYALDIVFDSRWVANDASLPIAADYGWAENDGGGWSGIGQRPANRGAVIPGGSTLYLSIFDASGAEIEVDNLTVSVAPGEDSKPNQPNSPFTTPPGDGLSFNLASPAASAGCNVQGSGGTPVPNGLSIVSLGAGQTGDWELTVTFDVTVDGSQKSFKVDPEMSVGPRG